MPITAFLKVPDIAGESQRQGREDEIDIHDMRWGVEQLTSAQIGRGRTRSRADMGPLVVYKYFDAASPYLALAVNQGRSFSELELAVSRDGGEAHLDYLVITMENVTLSAYNVASNRTDMADSLLEEEIEIEFERITLSYKVYGATGATETVHEVVMQG